MLRIHLFGQNPYESIYGLESEYISFFAIEYEYNSPWRDMDLSPKPDLDILSLTYQNSSLYVCPFGRKSGNTQTDRQTQTHTDDVKTITPDTSQMLGVMKGFEIFYLGLFADTVFEPGFSSKRQENNFLAILMKTNVIVSCN